jgi:hypothetical protein
MKRRKYQKFNLKDVARIVFSPAAIIRYAITIGGLITVFVNVA